MEMSLSEALGHIGQMSNFFKAFKKLEEVLLVAAQVEQNIKELEAKRLHIQNETSELEKKRDELIPLVGKLEAELKEKESKMATINAELASLKAKVS